MATDNRGHGDQNDEDLHEPLQSAGQIREAGGGDGHERGDLEHREMDAVTVDRRSRPPAAVTAQDENQKAGNRAGTDHAETYVTGYFEASGNECQHDEHSRDTESAGVVHKGHQRADAGRRWVHHPGDDAVHPVAVSDDQDAQEESRDGSNQAEAVAPAPAAHVVAHRGECHRAPSISPRSRGGCEIHHGRSGVHAHSPSIGPAGGLRPRPMEDSEEAAWLRLTQIPEETTNEPGEERGALHFAHSYVNGRESTTTSGTGRTLLLRRAKCGLHRLSLSARLSTSDQLSAASTSVTPIESPA